jgi:hypothetical protein
LHCLSCLIAFDLPCRHTTIHLSTWLVAVLMRCPDTWDSYQAAANVMIASTAVKIPAPMRSAFVTPVGMTCSSLSLPWPALASPFEVPPVSLESGPLTRSIRLLWITSSADICSPTPNIPSQPSTHHLCPQVTPSSPPEQDWAAAMALDRRYGSTASYVQGATFVVAAIQRAKYALKLRWSTSHLPFRSHTASKMTSLSVKKTFDLSRRPSTRARHFSWVAPVVCFKLVDVLALKCCTSVRSLDSTLQQRHRGRPQYCKSTESDRSLCS